MIRAYRPYCLHVLKFNVIVSLLVTLLSSTISINGITINQVLYWFIISFLSGGFLLGLLSFELGHKREFYIYYNLSISRLRLILAAYLLHLSICIILLIIVHYAKQI